MFMFGFAMLHTSFSPWCWTKFLVPHYQSLINGTSNLFIIAIMLPLKPTNQWLFSNFLMLPHWLTSQRDLTLKGDKFLRLVLNSQKNVSKLKSEFKYKK
jgi:hypothetical protein